MEHIYALFDFILHIDKHLDLLVQDYGIWTYAILFLIVFCETGLVITPFLPGDSLLFAAGAIAARGSMDVYTTALVIFVAAVIGDAVNYAAGKYIGPRVFHLQDSKIFKRQYLERTQHFYLKYGAKTIVIARFVPIVRTFAPFLAGVGSMSYSKFALYNIGGAALWTFLFVFAGYMFGELSIVKNNFTLVIMMIIVISIMPAVVEAFRIRRAQS